MELGTKAHSRVKSKVYMTWDVKDGKFNVMVKYIHICILDISHPQNMCTLYDVCPCKYFICSEYVDNSKCISNSYISFELQAHTLSSYLKFPVACLIGTSNFIYI